MIEICLNFGLTKLILKFWCPKIRGAASFSWSTERAPFLFSVSARSSCDFDEVIVTH